MQGKVQVILLTILAIVCVLGLAGFVGINYGDEIKNMMHQEPDSSVTRPFYVPLDKLVISVESGSTIYYLMVEVTLETGAEESIEQINYYMPAIRNTFVKNLSQRDFDSMRYYLKDINKLQGELHLALEGMLDKLDMVGVVDDVLITKLVIQ